MFPAFAHFRRTATEDTVLNGQEIKEGEKVVMWYVVLEPRRDPLRGPRPLRRPPQPRAPGVRRRRPPLLPRHRPRPARAEDPLRGDPRPLPGAWSSTGRPIFVESAFLNQLKTLPVRLASSLESPASRSPTSNHRGRRRAAARGLLGTATTALAADRRRGRAGGRRVGRAAAGAGLAAGELQGRQGALAPAGGWPRAALVRRLRGRLPGRLLHSDELAHQRRDRAHRAGSQFAALGRRRRRPCARRLDPPPRRPPHQPDRATDGRLLPADEPGQRRLPRPRRPRPGQRLDVRPLRSAPQRRPRRRRDRRDRARPERRSGGPGAGRQLCPAQGAGDPQRNRRRRRGGGRACSARRP